MAKFRTSEEAVARAKAWIDKNFPQNKNEWAEINHFDALYKSGYSYGNFDSEMFHKKTNGGGFGGLVIVMPHGDSDEGVVIAIENYSGIVKKFSWQV